MKALIISYDVPDTTDYNSIHETIKKYGNALPLTKSTWCLVTTHTKKEIFDKLRSQFPEESRIAIVKTFGILGQNLLTPTLNTE